MRSRQLDFSCSGAASNLTGVLIKAKPSAFDINMMALPRQFYRLVQTAMKAKVASGSDMDALEIYSLSGCLKNGRK
jgi:hypothetical protein